MFKIFLKIEELKDLITESLKEFNLIVDEMIYVKGNPNTLNVVLDSEEVITIDRIVEATKIISPIIDKSSFTNDSYILDVYGKEKGVRKNE